jgi:indolepyruvate decarboxylase
MNAEKEIGLYLIQRLYDLGIRHVFGVTGDYVLKFNKQLEDSSLQFINTCDEQGGSLTPRIVPLLSLA